MYQNQSPSDVQWLAEKKLLNDHGPSGLRYRFAPLIAFATIRRFVVSLN